MNQTVPDHTIALFADNANFVNGPINFTAYPIAGSNSRRFYVKPIRDITTAGFAPSGGRCNSFNTNGELYAMFWNKTTGEIICHCGNT